MLDFYGDSGRGRAGRLGSFNGSFPIPLLGHYCLYCFPLAACFGEIILTVVFTSGTRRDSFSLRAVMIRSMWHKGWNLDGGLRDWPSRGRRKGRLRVSAPSDSVLVTLLGHLQQWGA